MNIFYLKIKDIIQETPDVKTFLLEKPGDFNWEEGSHMHVGLPGFNKGEKPNKALVHHMSIMTLPEDETIGFTTRFIAPLSEFKNQLLNLNIGDEIGLFKFGSRMFLRRENKPIILVSMGVGIATMRPLIYRYMQSPQDIKSLINVNINSSDNFTYKNELDALENLSYKNLWINSRNDFYKELRKLSAEADSLYYIVGSDLFIQDVTQYLINEKVSKNRMFIDKKDEQIEKYFI